ncbi:unnamed protein product [Euphydryas editha]|uniref:Aspartyl-tRNA synthetase n=1 Tax=Euphydryas editha TaxID=104508 RepID=A0AAU9TF93_EUPED|nr:unnamed protein product [Euphydryas editha]
MVVSEESQPTAEGDAATSKKAAKKAAKAAEKQQKKAEHKGYRNQVCNSCWVRGKRRMGQDLPRVKDECPVSQERFRSPVATWEEPSTDPLAIAVKTEAPEVDISEGKYGNLKLIQSTGEHRDRVYTDVKDLGVHLDGKEVWVRARLQTSRAKGKQCFAVLRQNSSTVQLIISVNEELGISKQMVKFTGNITKESIVDVQALVVRTAAPVEACSVRGVELAARQLWRVSAARAQLPLLVEDAARQETDDPEGLKIRVNQDTRLDNRVLDLRTPANQAIFRIEAGVCRLFRDILTKRGMFVYFKHTFTPTTIGDKKKI